MKIFFKLLFVQLLLGLFFVNQAIAVPPQNIPGVGPKHVPEELIVKFKKGITAQEINIINLTHDTSILSTNPIARFMRLKIHGSNRSVRQLVEKYRGNKKVEYAEPNYIVHISQIPNDPDFSLLWNLSNSGQTGGTLDADIDIPEAWDKISNDETIVVAVIDSGVDYNHQDLFANIWNNSGEIPDNGLDDDANGYIDDVVGWNFSDNNNLPLDDNDHGTHVAGIIAATADNGIGIVGVSKKARIMVLKFLDAYGFGTTSDAANAIQYATVMGAKISNNSWGGSGYSQTIHDVITAAEEAGVLFIAAAGNEGTNNDILPFYPAGYNAANIITVGATDHNDEIANFSNYGVSSVDIAAPGVDIYSTTPDDTYSFMSGTSMAAPHVSAVAAMLIAEFPTLTYGEIKQRLANAVDPLSSLKGIVITGGRLNAHAALIGTVPPILPEPISVFDDSIENGINNWTITGDTSLWHQSNNRFISSDTAWYYGIEGQFNYDAGTVNQGSLITPTIDLSTISSSTLIFQHFLDTEETIGFDKVFVSISTDGGSTFTDIFTKPTTNGIFIEENLNIAAYDGESIQLQFSFDTVDNLYNSYEGWYLDDIKVVGQIADVVPNIVPSADAGVDQILSDDDGDGNEFAILDASGSFDADGSIIQYEWSDGHVVLQGINVDFSLNVGTHTVILTVTDDKGAMVKDELVITVNPNQTPLANAGADQTLTDSDNDTLESVTLTSSDSSDVDGSIIDYEWKDGERILGTAASITKDFGIGVHLISLTVTDNGGATATDMVLITIEPAPVSGPIVSIANIDILLLSRGSNYNVRGLVTVVEGGNSPVKGVLVTASWIDLNDDVIKTISNKTDKNGAVYLDYGKVAAKSGDMFKIVIIDAFKDGLTYVPSENLATSAKVIIP